MVLPTSLVGGNVDGGELRRVWALIRHAVDSLDLKAVLGVCLQVADRHTTLCQAQVARRDVHIVIAARAHATLRQALLADDVVKDVTSTARVAWLTPLQDQGGLIDVGDDAARRRGDGCGGRKEEEKMKKTVSIHLNSNMFYWHDRRIDKATILNNSTGHEIYLEQGVESNRFYFKHTGQMLLGTGRKKWIHKKDNAGV